MTELAYLTLAQASARIRSKELSPVDYTLALLRHIDTHDAKFNAFLRQTPEIALQQARQAEADIQAGNWRGPLHGIPYGLKDIIDVEGIPTTGHSKILADNLARTDAFVTSRLRAAGAVLLGKLSTHEFALAGRPLICPGRPARNAWNRDYFPGGSSSGSGRGPGCRVCPCSLGDRHRRLGAQPGLHVRHCRDESNLWACQPPWRSPLVVFPGSYWSNDPDCHGQRTATGRHCRA